MYSNFVTLAFRLRNSFDDSIEKKEEFIFYLDENKIHPIKKYEGYYVITNISNIKFCLKILSKNYFCKVVNVNLNDLKTDDRCIEIFLVPNDNMSKYTVKGNADPNSVIYVTKLSNRTNVRCQSLEKNNFIITVSNPANESLKGRVMAVVDIDKNMFEPLFIKEKLSENNYMVDLLENNNLLGPLPMQKAYITQSEKNGDFRVYLNADDYKTEKYILLYYKKGKPVFEILKFEEKSNSFII